ncbi:cell division protein FtsZ [Rhizorhabdus wittichii]|uniref:Cell division protein FtsZ n=2 Tax=Rhizorhabdus wittichii TaxID=160791 RepID=A0A9J9HEM2_RHIWR|nr:cell division protein FtsZ [Rhizorhabdus wittichii]ABQ70285.1 cell division protein FtsZ [Rhizorhabdus wittichii RW1]ARR52762.1 cell division protein FtsZ [Rhizorhabdus wittichii DC-6]QTH24166.1 cell division protein FtsZ [Rhizorhabdus wittichii]
MTIEFMRPQVDELKPRISVIGVGGAGGNAVANMIGADVQGVDFIVANTDAQALNASSAERRIQLGLKITQGLGAGSRPEIGRAAAEETLEQVEKALEGSHMCFIAAGMGGGTGTGAAPVIAKAARDRGILTVGVVTKPFSFEGNRRMRSADAGIEELQKHVDTLIVIPNQNLFLIANPNTTFKEAFQMADQVLQQGVRGITDLMVMPGLINLDFADVRSVMSEMGKAMMGTGEASGDNRAIEAAEKAIANPLLDGVSLNGAKGVIVSITGGDDMRLLEVDEAANHIRQLVDPDANIIWGSAFNNELEGRIRVSVVATGIEVDAATMPEPSKSFSFPPRTPIRDDKPVVVPQTPAPAPQAEAPAAQSQAAQPEAPATPAAAEAPAEEKIVLEAPEQAAAAEPLELTNLFNDELLLQPESAMPTPAPEAPADEDAASQGNRRWVTDAEPARRPSGAGSTLFERMSNIARGAAKAQVDDDRGGDDADIPRFLNRQSNQ